MRKRLGIIFLFVTLFIAFIIVWNYSYYKGLEEAYISVENNTTTPLKPPETKESRRPAFDLDYANMPVDENHQRSMKTYYDNRAFHGAPPSIPHEVQSEGIIGENNCLKCHGNGGYTEKFKAYAPVTPHPEMLNCSQCHVPQKTEALFKETGFKRGTIPSIGVNNALVGSPPVIPHQLQLHENCLACHAGPGAPKEIRVSHPDRVNCLQCHVLNNKETKDTGSFTRTVKN